MTFDDSPAGLIPKHGSVPMPAGEPLTRQEVEALPDGTRIIVIWSGGNGPHRYTLRHHRGYLVAVSQHDAEDFDLAGRCLGPSPDAFVGVKRFHTRVWLDEG